FMYEGRPFQIPASLKREFHVKKRWVRDSRTGQTAPIDWVYHTQYLWDAYATVVFAAIVTGLATMVVMASPDAPLLGIVMFLVICWGAALTEFIYFLKKSKRLGTEMMRLIVNTSPIGYWVHNQDPDRPENE
ncbi:hypothetical protein, partial [Weissella cibaria]|uniref:hypothetical protein n=1 Tax=Weissella cibaria TaxID=137591 RepID=UPI00143FB6CE